MRSTLKGGQRKLTRTQSKYLRSLGKYLAAALTGDSEAAARHAEEAISAGNAVKKEARGRR